MANMARSQVTVNSAWTEGGTNGRRRTCLDVTIVTSDDGTGQGSATNTIPASIFDLQTIEETTAGVTDANKHIPAAPSYDRTLVLLFNNTNATDANRANAADYVNTTIRLTLKGQTV